MENETPTPSNTDTSQEPSTSNAEANHEQTDSLVSPSTELIQPKRLVSEEQTPEKPQPKHAQTEAKPIQNDEPTWVKRAMTTSLNPEYIGKLNTLLPSLPEWVINVSQLLKFLVDYYISNKTKLDQTASRFQELEDELEDTYTKKIAVENELEQTKGALNKAMEQIKHLSEAKPDAATKAITAPKRTSTDFMDLLYPNTFKK